MAVPMHNHDRKIQKSKMKKKQKKYNANGF